MGSMESVKDVLQRIANESPASTRRLAEAAGLDHSALVRARQGEFTLSPVRVRALISALRIWEAGCRELADDLEAALKTETDEGDR